MSRHDVQPHEDYGFFGPDSVTWRVWKYPTSVTIGITRAMVIEELFPELVAAVDQTGDIYRRPKTRYDRTLRYFSMVVFGGSRETSRAADVLVKIHSKAIGTEPYLGGRYDANAPHAQLWIHVTAWHSILYAYEKYGPGKLSHEDEDRYWRECAIAAELQTCSSDDIPRSRDEVRHYFDDMRPQLSASPIAVNAMNQLLDAGRHVWPFPRLLKPLTQLNNWLLRTAVIATLPRWMRSMAGLHRSKLLDTLAVAFQKPVYRALARSPRLQVAILSKLSKGAVPVIAPVLLAIPPVSPEVVSPATARERYGYDSPADAHREWREKQYRRVFGDGAAPSDEGLVESQEVLGNLG